MVKSRAKRSGPDSIQVDMVSDIVCPWCWLGKRYFDQAVQKNGAKVNVTYRPYMLDPTVPKDGLPYRDYMKSKFGDKPDNRFSAMREQLEKSAPDAGIHFRFSELTVRPNTMRAHCLIRWAQGQSPNKGGHVKEALFKAYFDELRDIGDIDVLCDIAKANDMDAALVRELLIEGRDVKDVAEEMAFFRGLGISGVPTFIYNGQFAVQGAQPVAAHIQAIAQAAEMPAQDDE
ncbi:DsbA family oxidoreductase [Robiginitomaculum antarcticum]|uniref:DsbA family oxidoreductase n=1 Tax=Robiginitomaculum antarcticum TaxID=437507 RepID=UPI000366DF6D|nr:DsbA family oxidoreductase [Robiginitomaculum antarcticum]